MQAVETAYKWFQFPICEPQTYYVKIIERIYSIQSEQYYVNR